MVNMRATSLLLHDCLSFRLINDSGSRVAALKYKKRLHSVPLCSKHIPVTGGELMLKV